MEMQGSPIHSFQNNKPKINYDEKFSSDQTDGLGVDTVSPTFVCAYTKQSWTTLNMYLLDDSYIVRPRYTFEPLGLTSGFCQYLHLQLKYAVATGILPLCLWQSTIPAPVYLPLRLQYIYDSGSANLSLPEYSMSHRKLHELCKS